LEKIPGPSCLPHLKVQEAGRLARFRKKRVGKDGAIVVTKGAVFVSGFGALSIQFPQEIMSPGILGVVS
jgi:hypothetical protein